MEAIQTESLTKRYGAHTALSALNLQVDPGQLFGFLGPNGAGKTTAIRTMLGLLRPTSGRAIILGRDAWHAGMHVRTRVGYLPGDVRFYDHMTGRATLRFLAAARGLNCQAQINRLTALFDLDLRRRVRNYSRGMKQKLGLIAALMHAPQLLILDEPTTALDPLVRESLYEELRRIVAAGRTVLFSSHTLAEVEQLCDEVAILRAGVLVEQERVAVLRERAVRHVELRFAPDAPLPDRWPAGLEIAERDGRRVSAAWTGPVAQLIAALGEYPLDDAIIAPPNLDDLFLAYYRAAAAEDGA